MEGGREEGRWEGMPVVSEMLICDPFCENLPYTQKQLLR